MRRGYFGRGRLIMMAAMIVTVVVMLPCYLVAMLLSGSEGLSETVSGILMLLAIPVFIASFIKLTQIL